MEPKIIAVVGLGYVGLPLALALSSHFSVLGYDVNRQRIEELQRGVDRSGEHSLEEITPCPVNFTPDPSLLRTAQMIIVCVPTPVDEHKKPDLQFVNGASEIVGRNMSAGTIVVYESTVYPSVTEEICIPLLEQCSGMNCGQGFSVGYSPERMNPGDKEHALDRVVKVVSGINKETLDTVDAVYSKITKTHRAPSIKVAEAAKVIENIQRDLNIALMNELTILFDTLGIRTQEVLKAAGTKWNFHHYHPGLVGGHCIGIDPYYLTYAAEKAGHHPDVILAGRRINDAMHQFYAEKVLKRLHQTNGKSVFVLGLTFKPNVSDYRNSRVKHFIQVLKEFHVAVYAYDPYLPPAVVEKEFNAVHKEPTSFDDVDIVVAAVEHQTLEPTFNTIPAQKLIRLSSL